MPVSMAKIGTVLSQCTPCFTRQQNVISSVGVYTQDSPKIHKYPSTEN
jgi:hypothetical protein